MKTLTTFCGYHPLEMVTHPLGLFPAEKKDDPMWCNRVSHVKYAWAMYVVRYEKSGFHRLAEPPY